MDVVVGWRSARPQVAAAFADDTRNTSWPRRAKNTAIGIHAGPAGPDTTTSRVPSGAPARAARSTASSDSTAGTQDARQTSRPSGSRTRTACRDAIPRSIPTSRLHGGWLSCSSICTSPSSPELPDSGGTAGAATLTGHGPRAQEPGNGSHSCAATGPAPHLSWPTSLMRVIRGQASSGNQIRETRPEDRPQNLRVATYRTSRGCSRNPGTPAPIKHRSSLHEPATSGL